VAGSHEHGSEPSGSTKCGEFVDQLSNHQLLKTISTPIISEIKLADVPP
jgi:hypothetical protein